jgi:hypothetical protein
MQKILRTCLLLLLLAIVHTAFAQDINTTTKWKFHSLNQAGILRGQDVFALELQSVNGFERNGFFAGLGIGYDSYTFESIPLFADVRKYFGNSKHSFFVYLDGGVNFVSEKKENKPSLTTGWRNGFYGDGGVGCRIRLSKGPDVLVSTGYSYKRVTKTTSATICPLVGPCYTDVHKYMYNLNRISVKIGLLF